MAKTPRPSTRPTKTKEWPNTVNPVNITLREKDQLLYYETDDLGKIRTNKRGWQGLTATVVPGNYKENNGSIEIPAGIQIYECDVLDKGTFSRVPIKNTSVTVIIHE